MKKLLLLLSLLLSALSAQAASDRIELPTSSKFMSNVGINDGSPDAQLDIKSNSASAGEVVRVSSQNDTGAILSILGNGAVSIGDDSPDYSGVLVVKATAANEANPIFTVYSDSRRLIDVSASRQIRFGDTNENTITFDTNAGIFKQVYSTEAQPRWQFSDAVGGAGNAGFCAAPGGNSTIAADGACVGLAGGGDALGLYVTNDTAMTEVVRVKKAGSVRFIPLATAPSSPEAGDMYVDSTPAADELCFYDGAAWQGISSGTDANCS